MLIDEENSNKDDIEVTMGHPCPLAWSVYRGVRQTSPIIVFFLRCTKKKRKKKATAAAIAFFVELRCVAAQLHSKQEEEEGDGSCRRLLRGATLRCNAAPQQEEEEGDGSNAAIAFFFFFFSCNTNKQIEKTKGRCLPESRVGLAPLLAPLLQTRAPSSCSLAPSSLPLDVSGALAME